MCRLIGSKLALSSPRRDGARHVCVRVSQSVRLDRCNYWKPDAALLAMQHGSLAACGRKWSISSCREKQDMSVVEVGSWLDDKSHRLLGGWPTMTDCPQITRA